MDKAKKFTARGDVIFCASGSNNHVIKLRQPVSVWVESATIQGQGCPSDGKEGIELCFVLVCFCGPFNVTVFRSMEKWKAG